MNDTTGKEPVFWARKRVPGRSPLDPVWVLATLGGIFAFVSTHPIRPPDFWWHLPVGQIVAETGTVPTTDVFSFTAAGQPYIYLNWLAGLAFFAAYRVGGPELVVLMQALTITLAYGLILTLCWRIARNARLAAFATLLAVAVSIGNWNVRPQTFSILLFAVFLVILTRYRRGQRAWIGLLPLLMVAWVNLHGAFVLGFALTVLMLAGEMAKCLARWQPALSWRALGQLTGVAVLLLPAMLVNPRGPLIYQYMQSYFAAVPELLAEWLPTDIRTPDGLIFFGVAGLVALLFLLRGRRTDPTDLLVYGAFLWLGTSAVRNQIWFGLVVAPLVAEYIPAVWPPVRVWLAGLPGLGRFAHPRPVAPAHPWVNAAFAGLILLGLVASLPWIKVHLPLPEAKRPIVSLETPVGAGEYLAAHPPSGHILQNESDGAYFDWRLWPQVPVFIDVRIGEGVFPTSVRDDYLALRAGRYDWETLLAHYGIDTLVLDKENLKYLADLAAASPNWGRVYENSRTIIYQRLGNAHE